MGALTRPIRSLLGSLREAMSNEGIRRLEASWALGIAADTGLLVVLIVVIYLRDGVVAAGVLGAVRMVPAVVSGMLAGASIERFRGERVLLAVGLDPGRRGGPVRPRDRDRRARRSCCSCSRRSSRPPARLVRPDPGHADAGHRPQPERARRREHGLEHRRGPRRDGRPVRGGPARRRGAAGAGAPSPPLARSSPRPSASPGCGSSRRATRPAARARPPAASGSWTACGRCAAGRSIGWTMLGVFTPGHDPGPARRRCIVVAAIELLAMGEAGVGLLNAALGLGGLVGAIFAISLTRTDRLIRTQAAALAYWGAPIAVIGLLPSPGRRARGDGRGRRRERRLRRRPVHDHPARHLERGARAGVLGVRGRWSGSGPSPGACSRRCCWPRSGSAARSRSPARSCRSSR